MYYTMRVDMGNRDDEKQIYNLTASTIHFKINSQRPIQIRPFKERSVTTSYLHFV